MLANVNMFIIRVGFRLTNIDMIRILTQPIDINCHSYLKYYVLGHQGERN